MKAEDLVVGKKYMVGDLVMTYKEPFDSIRVIMIDDEGHTWKFYITSIKPLKKPTIYHQLGTTQMGCYACSNAGYDGSI